MNFDVVVVGAGPAGLFASYELLKKNKDLKVCLIDRGKPIKERKQDERLFGFGGAGTFSDGKLHYSPILSHEKILDVCPLPEYEEILNYVDSVFTSFGVTSEYYPKNMENVQELVNECKKAGVHLFIRKTKHVGSDKLPEIISKFERFLLKNKIVLKTECEIVDIVFENGECKGVVTGNGEKIYAEKVILAPGRSFAEWLQDLARKYGVEFKYEPVEVGVRVEFPRGIMKKYSDLMYEAVFLIYSPSFDDAVRTFCPCPRGYVSVEDYGDFVCVNGHSNSTNEGENSNFALVTIINLTEPVENTLSYGKSIAKLSTTIGGGKPIIQRLSDLKAGRRSTWDRINKSYVRPSLKEVTPGDISMALPHRIVTNIVEGLEILDKVMPGINSGSTLLYAPEIKLRSSKIKTSKNLETSIKNLYVAGDGAGVSGNIVGAAATGIIAARGILESI